MNEPTGTGYETIPPPLPFRNDPQYETVEMYSNPISNGVAEYTYVRADTETNTTLTAQRVNRASELNTGESSTPTDDNLVRHQVSISALL